MCCFSTPYENDIDNIEKGIKKPLNSKLKFKRFFFYPIIL